MSLAVALLMELLISTVPTAAALDSQQKPPLVARHVVDGDSISTQDITTTSPAATAHKPTSLSFKVLQLADLHFTGNPLWPCRDAPWEGLPAHTPCNEALMATFVDELLDLEKPNFVVFSGDNVQTFDDPFHQKAVDAFTRGVEARGIPHAEILGNHDDDWGFAREKVLQMGMDKRFSYTQRGPKAVDGVGNYQLSVLAPVDGIWGEQGESVFHMYFLDSGGRLDKQKYPDVRSRYDWIHDSQVAYYQELSRASRKKKVSVESEPNLKSRETTKAAHETVALPAIMFFHIPLREYLHASIQYWRRTGAMNEKVEPSDVQSSLFQALVEVGEVKATFAGHDHTNAYCYLREGIQLCTGGGAGLGEAYSDPEFVRRARVIEWSVNSENERTIRSWKRLFGASTNDVSAAVSERVEEEVLFTQNPSLRVGLLMPPNASSAFVVIPHLCALVVLLLILVAIGAMLAMRAWRAMRQNWLPQYGKRQLQQLQTTKPGKFAYAEKQTVRLAGHWNKLAHTVRAYAYPVKAA